MNAGPSRRSGICGRPELRLRFLTALTLTLGFALVAAPGTSGSTTDPPRDETGPTTEAPGAMPPVLSETELKLVSAFRDALQRPEVRAATRKEVARQVRQNPPLALVRGFWTTGVNLSRLFRVPVIRDAVGTAFEDATWRPAGAEPQGPGRLRWLAGLAFTPHQLRHEVGVPHADHLEITEPVQGPRTIIFLVLTSDEKEVVVEYLPPEPASGCYYFCGDPEEWDFDGDGVPNRTDDDDDGDGVGDRSDAFPYWRGGSARPRASVPFVGFTEKFSDQIAVVILRALDRVEETLWSELSPRPGAEPETANGFHVVFP